MNNFQLSNLSNEIKNSKILKLFLDNKFIDKVPSTNSLRILSVNATAPKKVSNLSSHLPIIYNDEYFNDDEITIEKINSSYLNESLILGTADDSGLNWNAKYIVIHFNGIPDSIKFKYRTYSTISGNVGECTSILWFIQLDTHNSFDSLEPKCTVDDERNAWYSTNSFSNNVVEVKLNPDTKWIKIYYAGNYYGIISDIEITELKYLKILESNTIDFGSESLGINHNETAEINIDWCNTPEVTITNSDRTHFTVIPDKFAQLDSLGRLLILITYDRTKDIGIHDAIITISNDIYTKTISVHGETTKKTPKLRWHPNLVSANFLIPANRYPKGEIGYIAQLSNKGTLKCESTNPDVFKQQGTRFSLNEGEADVTFSYAGDNEYNAVSDTKTIHVVAQTVETLYIIWNQLFLSLTTQDSPIKLNADAISGGDIVYTSDNVNVVTIEGDTLKIVGEGEANITARLEGGVIYSSTYAPIEMTKHVVVRSMQSCITYALLQLDELTFINNSNNPIVYNLTGMPDSTLYFRAYIDASSGIWAKLKKSSPMIIQEKINDNWNTIFNSIVSKGLYLDYSCNINNQSTAIRLYTIGNTQLYIKDIKIKRRSLIEPEINELTCTSALDELYTKEIKVNYLAVLKITISHNGEITLNKEVFDNDCEMRDTNSFIISLSPEFVNKAYQDTIIISDGLEEHTKQIPIKITATHYQQSILGFSLDPITILSTDEIIFAGYTLPGNPVYYTSSDDTIAYVDEYNKLIILASGIDLSATVTITAHCDSTTTYDAAPNISKIITINKV